MPLNHIELQPQIKDFVQKAGQARKTNEEKLQTALNLLHACCADADQNWMNRAASGTERCGLPANEPVDQAIAPAQEKAACLLLAADGSQITPSLHDPVPLSLINTSRIVLDTSSEAPQVLVRTQLLNEENTGIEVDQLSEDLVNLKRDVSELEILQDWQASGKLPAAALRDGPLELFHEPRQGKAFAAAFDQYRLLLEELGRRDIILAGYIDRSRATLITTMLGIFAAERRKAGDVKDLPDIFLMEKVLGAGERSAILELHSTSSIHYEGNLRVHFFYLNVSQGDNPYIVRVEIPAWVAEKPAHVILLQNILLDQCRLMNRRPYPYLLHRAHEEAVVHFDEKEQLQNALGIALQREGLGFSQPSHKLAAKELQKRTRM